MENWKERFVQEYKQLKERYEKLKSFNTAVEVDCETEPVTPIRSDEDVRRNKTDMYRKELMERQQHLMGEYLHVLELRAVLEHIDLN